eukprot:jgi/Galph1/5328/GphlegSOOS_G3928.1
MKFINIVGLLLAFVAASYAAVVAEMPLNDAVRGGYAPSPSQECCDTTCQYAQLCPLPQYSQPSYAQPSYNEPSPYSSYSSSSSYRLLTSEENAQVNRGGYVPSSQCILVPVKCCTDCT